MVAKLTERARLARRLACEGEGEGGGGGGGSGGGGAVLGAP